MLRFHVRMYHRALSPRRFTRGVPRTLSQQPALWIAASAPARLTRLPHLCTLLRCPRITWQARLAPAAALAAASYLKHTTAAGGVAAAIGAAAGGGLAAVKRRMASA